MDLRREYNFGGTSESGKVVMHTEMMIHYHNGEDSVNGGIDEPMDMGRRASFLMFDFSLIVII